MSVCGELSSIAETPVTVTISVIGDTAQQDFTLSPISLSFQPGATQSCTVVTATVDNTLEEDEVFTLGLQSTNNLVQISQTAGMTAVTVPNQDSKSTTRFYYVIIYTSILTL